MAAMEVDGELQCPICLDLFTGPIILPCSHILCRRPCAENLFDDTFIRCPVCRDNCYITGGIGSLPRVLALENIIEKYKAIGESRQRDAESPESGLDDVTAGIDTENEVLCQLCDGSPRRAKKSCLDCNASYCNRCLRISHPTREPFSLHDLVEPRCPLRPKDVLCTEHGEKLTIYCYLCKAPCCILCVEKDLHPVEEGHKAVSLEEAYAHYKGVIETSLSHLENSQSKLSSVLATRRARITELQTNISVRRELVNHQCNALVSEVEAKRRFFLADLDYEERVRQADIESSVSGLERLMASGKSVTRYSHDVMAEKEAGAFLQLANALNDRLVRVTLDCDSCPVQPEDQDNVHVVEGKVVDFRKEKAILQDMHYLLVPATPIIDVTRCSRSEDTVALVVCPPKNHHDVIDQYQVQYFSEEQKALGLEDHLEFGNPQEDRQLVKGVANGGFLVLLIENLCRGTTYYFRVTASNATGKSAASEAVQCATLLHGEGIVPVCTCVVVPVILDSLCRRYTASIQICSSSPLDVVADQKISHYLLFRDSTNNRAYKSVSMFGRQEHRVFGLDPNTDYDFMIMACNQKGESQLSNKVTLQTEVSALEVVENSSGDEHI